MIKELRGKRIVQLICPASEEGKSTARFSHICPTFALRAEVLPPSPICPQIDLRFYKIAICLLVGQFTAFFSGKTYCLFL